MKKKALIIGHTFPEPNTTAAGSRIMQIISILKEADYNLTFATTATKTNFSENLEILHISVEEIILNHSSFNNFIKQLNPNLIVFDRFITEEQFGWRVTQNCPNALKILDTEDLHFLRKAREDAFKNNTKVVLYSELAKRELASILRCDVALIISKAEIQLLIETFKIPEGLLYYLPFLVTSISINTPLFKERQNFISIGNFKHTPNLDAVINLKKQIWPIIKKHLPEAQLHIYGAYAPQQVLEMHNEEDGFLVKGWAEKVSEVMSKARVNLAPLRFGAGLKGKLVDAAINGTPSVTTAVGDEGMFGIATVTNDVTDFIESAIMLYNNELAWQTQQNKAYNVIKEHFMFTHFSDGLIEKILNLEKDIYKHRNAHFLGQIIQHQSLQATKFMSKWIEEKNKKI